MKSNLRLGILAICIGSMLAPVSAQSITAAEAAKHIGEIATVCGRVASETTATSSKGQPTFVNLDSAYPKQIFTALVWGEDRDKVGELPPEGAHMCVKGSISSYKGVPEIVVREKSQITR
jgi:hypothetical protein